MSASDHLGEQFAMMRPSELLPYAADRSDKFGKSKVAVLMSSIQEHGYHEHLAQGNKAPITLGKSGTVTHLTEGNHRVHAMNRMGYDEPVRVRLT